MRNSISLSAIMMRLAAAVTLAAMAWGGDALRLSVGGGGRSADGLIVDYKMGEALPGVISGNVVSNLGAVPYTVAVQSSGWLTVSPLAGTTPGVIEIRVNPSGLGVGTYAGSITVQTTVQVDGKILDASDTSPVTLRVAAGVASTVTVASTSLSFDGTVGQALAAQTVKVSSSPGSVNFTVTPSQPWFSVNPVSGITNGAAGQSVSVYVNTAGLAAGDYSGILTVATPGATPASQTVAVALKLRSVVNVLTMAPPASLSFTGVAGGAIPAGQSFGLEAGLKNLTFTLKSGAAWLAAIPASGVTPGVVAVQVNPAGLAEGTYQGVVETTVPDATPAVYQTVVTLVLSKAPAEVLVPLTVTPVSMSFAGMVGGANPPAAMLTVAGPAGGATVTVGADVGWIKVNPIGSTTPLSVEVQILTSGLTAGERTGHVTLTRTDVTPNLVTTVLVALSMSQGPVINLSPSSVSLQGRAGESGGAGAQATLTLSTTSAAPVLYELTVTSAGTWLSVTGSPINGQVSAANPVILNLSGDAKSLASGSYDGVVALKIPGQSTGGVSVPVVFVVAPALPALEVTPAQLSLSGLAGGMPVTGKIQVKTNPGTLQWTAGVAIGWLKATPSSGSGSQELTLIADPGKLAPGKYSDVLVINGGAGQQTTVLVTLEVQPATAPAFGVSPESLEFTKMQGAAGTGQQTAVLTGLTAEQAGNGQIQWTATPATKSGGSWLSAELVNAGVLPLTLKVYADAAGLSAGVYEGTVTVTSATVANTSAAQVAVRLTVTEPKVLSYAMNPVAVSADRVEGSTEKELVDVALVPAQGGLQYTAAVTGGGWLTISGAGDGQMPATVHISMDPTGLKPGLYKGKLTVTGSGSGVGTVLTNPVQVTDLVLTVTATPPPSVKVSGVSGDGLVFDLDYPNDNPGTVSLANLRNAGSGVVPVRVASDTPWLTFASGVIPVGNGVEGVPLMGILNASAAPGRAGSYVAGYTLTVEGVGQIYSGSVGLLVNSSAPSIDLAPQGSTLTLGEAYAPESSTVAFDVRNTGMAEQVITVTPGALLTAKQGGALTLQPGENAVLKFSVNGGLAAGVYTSGVRLVTSTEGGSLESAFSVGLEVLARPPLSVTGGGYKSTTPGEWAQFQIVLKNPRVNAAAYFVSTGPLAGTAALSNVNADPVSGTVAGGSEVTVTVAGQAGLTPGLYGQSVAVNFGGDPFVMPMVVGAMPSSGLLSEGKARMAGGCENGQLLALFLNMQDGTVVKAGLPAAIEMLAVNTCGGLVTKGSVSATPSNGDAAIQFQPGASAGTWVGTWTPVDTSSPEVSLTLTAWDEVTKLRGTAKVRLVLQRVAAIPMVTSVVNPADGGTEGATAAGGWLAIQGKNLAAAVTTSEVKPYPVELGGTKVLLGDRALPLMKVSPGEVYAFVPYDVVTGSVLPVQVVRGQLGSTPVAVAVNVQMPALFRKDPKGETREGRVVASRGDVWFDASLSNPVTVGDILYIEAVALGPVDQNVSPDKVAPSDPLARVQAQATATLGGVPVQIWYLGLIPETVGVYQVRIEVPPGVAAANDVPIVVTIGGQSNAAVTVAVR